LSGVDTAPAALRRRAWRLDWTPLRTRSPPQPRDPRPPSTTTSRPGRPGAIAIRSSTPLVDPKR